MLQYWVPRLHVRVSQSGTVCLVRERSTTASTNADNPIAGRFAPSPRNLIQRVRANAGICTGHRGSGFRTMLLLVQWLKPRNYMVH